MRFGDLFFKHWSDAGMEPRPGQPGRKLISSLPGNHDLGFARGVQMGVRDRFNAYFGDGNRIDVIANHTFVSIDSVSLSAFGQESPQEVENIWKPTKDFLGDAKKRKRRLVQRELRAQQGLKPYPGMPHYDIELKDLAKSELPHANDEVTEFPTILLSHVPLYRPPGTPCGPFREHWPPTPPPAGQPPLEHDDRNAISVRGGYQYQNVLNREITAEIAEKVGDIRYAFSGDDHDYCDVVHKAYASAGGGIREITVKSISWAMGVRRPGIVMLSLWNPVDKHGKPLKGDGSKTVQTKLCLLPDQIGTFLKYGMLFGLTLTLLVFRAALITLGILSNGPSAQDTPLLPTTNNPNSSSLSSAEHEKSHPLYLIPPETTHSSNSSTSSERGTTHLSVRSTTQGRTRAAAAATTTTTTSPQNASSYGLPPPTPQPPPPPPPPQPQKNIPLLPHPGYNPDLDYEDQHRKDKFHSRLAASPLVQSNVSRSTTTPPKLRSTTRRKGMPLFWYHFRCSFALVVASGLVAYAWLLCSA